MKLLRITYPQAKNLCQSYKVLRKGSSVENTQLISKHIKIKKKGFKLPSGVTDLQPQHKAYLKKRGFDPQYLIDNWSIKGTSPTSYLDGISYKFRILAPIQWGGKVVTFQARDYTGKQELKYMACPEEREIIHHKHILYGHPSLWTKRRGILVEGIFDVWRLRLSACCTFGTGYTNEQIKLMIKMFDELFIFFDPEPIAQKRANEIKEELSFWGVKCLTMRNAGDKDPGDMKQKDADYLLKELNML